jgi:toxin-antitoxin system PIN domain toxin
VDGDEPFGVPSLVFSGFLRVVTHPRIFSVPSPLPKALGFVEAVRRSPAFLAIEPGPRHWTIFLRFCEEAGVKGNLVADAYLAAVAIESGSDWITTDRDYSRFPGLRARHPLKTR